MLAGVFVVAEAALGGLCLAFYLATPDLWSPYLPIYPLLLAMAGIALLFVVPIRVCVEGSTLRIRYPLREVDTPLGDVVALDLAPGSRTGWSMLRAARSSGKILPLSLDAAAADALASWLERLGLMVNRNPPPFVRPQRSA